MRQRLIFLVMVVALFASSAVAVAAQEVDPAFSDEKLGELGYPVVQIHVGPDGVEAPSTLEAGYYLIEFSSEGEYAGYLDIMVPPDGLSQEEATELALAAARDDLAQPGWQYLGGANTFEVGVPVTFAIYLAPGEYQVAASYYLPNDANEIMTLVPLTVTEPGSGATPVSATPEARAVFVQPAVDVTLIMNDDLQYIVDPDGSAEAVPAGPQIWEITNTGTEHSHHVVMWSVPEGTTADDITAELGGLMMGTPPAEDALMMQMQGVGYAALQSGGHKTWYEFDLAPGSYAVICYIIDPETGMPHVMNGMVTVFEVE